LNGFVIHSFVCSSDATICLLTQPSPAFTHHLFISFFKKQYPVSLSPCWSSTYDHGIRGNADPNDSSSTVGNLTIVNLANVCRACCTKPCNMSDNWPIPTRTRPWMIWSPRQSIVSLPGVVYRIFIPYVLVSIIQYIGVGSASSPSPIRVMNRRTLRRTIRNNPVASSSALSSLITCRNRATSRCRSKIDWYKTNILATLITAEYTCMYSIGLIQPSAPTPITANALIMMLS
jgi:hypothetical protein